MSPHRSVRLYYFRYLAFVASSDSCFRQELCCRNRTVFNGPYFPPEDILPTQVRVPDPKQTQHRPGPAMDEQAGPFFNNNNNNSGFPGNIKAPQTVDTGGGEAARSQYNIPGILHFLQHEWARYEVDRAHWDVERAELQGCLTLCSVVLNPENLTKNSDCVSLETERRRVSLPPRSQPSAGKRKRKRRKLALRTDYPEFIIRKQRKGLVSTRFPGEREEFDTLFTFLPPQRCTCFMQETH
ncbi:hypothetical protein NQZ68_033965 [Dissostichus eleginoides]|nr:hypothetical protein NQZ68_033965 [Dissostichus eleginoides]